MALEHLSERLNTDRSQQVIGLLAELSERLKRAETERDLVKREMLTIRECIQDLNDQSDQTQKALLAFENKFDATETIVETATRRLGALEETVDKQSTELLGILRKIEERFDSYDREYKNHAASIVHYGDTLDRFDKKLEKLMQDKGRIARKLDTLEFQLADAEDRLQGGRTTSPARRDSFYDEVAAVAETFDAPDTTPTWVNNDAARPAFTQGPANDIPTPRVNWGVSSAAAGKVWQYGAVATLVLLIAAISYGVIATLLQNIETREAKITTPAPIVATLPAPETTTPTPTEITDTATKAAPTNTTKVAVPDKDFFSKTVRNQMDTQVVAARKLEDDDAARLMAEEDTTPLTTRLKRDADLPRAIKAIEEKAANGDAEAQHDMGALYTSGQSGVTVDYARAAFWFREAAQNGVANARYNLGVLYQQGLGVQKDMDQALAWYRAAALLEHPEARYNLGIAYVEGIGVTYNPAMAAGYFEQAARAGVVEAAYNLGLILENGLIDEPRPFEGLFWYKLAMDGGSPDASRAFTRLSQNLGVNDNAWGPLYTRMLAERPDLKQLADSRSARTLSTANGGPKVRIHNAAKIIPVPATPAAATTNDDAAKSATAPVAPTARMTPPAPPVKVATTTPAKIVTPEPPSQTDTDRQMTARIQAMLADEGMYKGKPDGSMGPATANAIRRYQTKYGMDVDGKPSTTLMAQMLAKRLSETVQPAAGDNKKDTNN